MRVVSCTTRSDELRARVEALDHGDRARLAVLALANDMLSSGQWAARVKAHGVGKSLGSTPADLVELGLVGQDYTRGRCEYFTTTLVALTVLEHLHEQGRLGSLVEQLPPPPAHGWVPTGRLATDLRLAVLDEDAGVIEAIVEQAAGRIYERDFGPWLCGALGMHPRLAALRSMPELARARYFGHAIPLALDGLLSVSDDALELGLEFAGRGRPRRVSGRRHGPGQRRFRRWRC